MTTQRKWLLAGILVPAELVLAALAWRDLGRRTDDQVRGTTRLWRLIVVLNPGNAIIYWLVGRSR